MRFRRGDIEKSDAATGDAAHRQNCIEHAGRVVVGGIPRATRDFENTIAAGQRLADIRTMPDMCGRLREYDLRHG
jgi:hypothetical protein